LSDLKPGVGAARPKLTRPQGLLPSHDCSKFSCRHEALDDWLKSKALKAEGRTARSYVVCDEGSLVVGYYCIATGAVARQAAPKKISRNAPDPVPVAIIGRLAVARDLEGIGIGSGMLQDAFQRILQIAQSIGCAAIVVHAIDQDAVGFYAKFNFIEFPGGTRTMFLPLATLRAAL
jgi:GNAT superfamily N-acetyltransferase